jgi:Ca2+-binding EF-hand superfamily protein
MMKTAATLLMIACLSLNAARPDVSKLPPPADRPGLTYEKDIRPIFEASCFNCHSRRAQRVRADLRLDTLQDILRGSEDGKILFPGNSRDSFLVHAVAQLDDETAMPPKVPERPTGLMGARGGGGSRVLAGPMFAQGDRDKDKKLTKDEFTGVADAWFDKLDPDKAGKLSQQQFAEKFGDVLAAPGQATNAGPGQRERARGGFDFTAMIAPGVFTATDIDKDGSLTRSEFRTSFAKWFTDIDSTKSGAIDEPRLREGLDAALPAPNFFGGRGGGFGAGNEIAARMLALGDKDSDKKLTKDELSALAEALFGQFDTNKAGKVTQEEFVARSTDVFPRQAQGMFGGPAGAGGGFAPGGGGQRGGGRSDGGRPEGGREPGRAGQRGDDRGEAGGRLGGGQRGGGLPDFGGGGGAQFGGGRGRSFAPGLFSALDTDKDKSLTRGEIRATFETWLKNWDAENTGALTEATLREKLNAALPRPEFGAFGGTGGAAAPGAADRGEPGRTRGGGRPEGAAPSGTPPKPLTPDQVALVRAWIDQGAK